MATKFSGCSPVAMSPPRMGVRASAPPEAGAESQSQLGLFFGTSLVDAGTPDVALNVVEVVVSTASLMAGGQGDVTGKQLASVAFSDSSSATADIGIYAMTVRDGVGSATGICCRGSTCNTTITSSAACTGSLIGGQFAGAAFVSGTACNSGAISSTPCAAPTSRMPRPA